MTYMRTTAAAVLVAATFAWPSAASAADKETRQMMADIRMLQEQSQELQNTLGAITEALKALNGRLDQQSETTRKSFADQKLTVDSVSGDLRIIRERMDDNNVRIGSLTQEVDALRQTVLQLNVGQPASLESPDGAPAASPSPAAPALAGGLSPEKAYNTAMADVYAGNYELAVAGLEGYLKDFPRSERADDAQLAIGNSYLQLGKNDKAVESYDLAIRNYPKGDKAPEAHYRKGVALSNLKQVDAARGAFEFVIKNYPDSPEATLAKQGLEKLPAPAAPPPARR